MYLSNKKKDKTINDHSVLIDKIRREYLELYKENQNLKLTIQNYERYYNDQQLDNYNNYSKRQTHIPKKHHKRKRRHQKSYNTSSSKTKDEELYIPKRKLIKKRKQKKVYDDVDGNSIDDYPYFEQSSPTDDDIDDNDDDNNNDNEKKNSNVKNKKLIQKPTKNYNKKGITKSIKVLQKLQNNVNSFLTCNETYQIRFS